MVSATVCVFVVVLLASGGEMRDWRGDRLVIASVSAATADVFSVSGSVSDCSREVSRLARSFAETEIYPFMQSTERAVDLRRRQLPLSCPLHPHNDLYADQEQHKTLTNLGSREWRCEFCGKIFRTEMYIDRHMEHHHADFLNNASSTCIADLCPIFGCSVKKTSKNSELAPAGHCTEATVNKMVHQCQSLMRRCFDGMRSVEGQPLDAFLESRICDELRCSPTGNLIGRGNSERVLSSSPIKLWLLQAVLVVVLAVFVLGYAYFADFPLFAALFSARVSSSDVLRGQQRALREASLATRRTAQDKTSLLRRLWKVVSNHSSGSNKLS